MIDLQDVAPLVMYDNRCYLCTKFARIVDFAAGKRLLLVGHYTDLGEKIRGQILDSSALEMFWFVDGKTAFGGRAAVIPLISAIISRSGRASRNSVDDTACDTGCRTAKAVFLRSASLLSHSKKIKLD
jgi:predicted DCC family thiol-disulfide oxidoreductase YuxK